MSVENKGNASQHSEQPTEAPRDKYGRPLDQEQIINSRLGKWEAHDLANMMRASMQKMAEGRNVKITAGDYDEALRFVERSLQNPTGKDHVELFKMLSTGSKALVMGIGVLSDPLAAEIANRLEIINLQKMGQDLGKRESEELAESEQ